MPLNHDKPIDEFKEMLHNNMYILKNEDLTDDKLVYVLQNLNETHILLINRIEGFQESMSKIDSNMSQYISTLEEFQSNKVRNEIHEEERIKVKQEINAEKASFLKIFPFANNVFQFIVYVFIGISVIIAIIYALLEN